MFLFVVSEVAGSSKRLQKYLYSFIYISPIRFRVIRLHDLYLTRAECRAFSPSALRHGSLPQQLKVVWSLLLQADLDGLILIFHAVSWRTISNTCELGICRSEVLLRVS